jgi:hypothetical protein
LAPFLTLKTCHLPRQARDKRRTGYNADRYLQGWHLISPSAEAAEPRPEQEEAREHVWSYTMKLVDELAVVKSDAAASGEPEPEPELGA